LGKHTSQGSSLLIMAVVGGALVPPLQAALADSLQSFQLSYLVPAACYLYLAFYGWVGAGIGRKGFQPLAHEK
ncbi:MAG TPA: hypothetical protein VHS96_11665, partial [Bacteroidia bacterium]|nr:hypothetical protein [Bacteroidia bacterium]